MYSLGKEVGGYMSDGMDERELVGFAVVGDDFVLVYDEGELGEVVVEWGDGDFYVRKGDE